MDKAEKLLECYRRLKEEGAIGVPTNNASSGNIAGLPPDDPPVDLRRKKYRNLNMFYRQAVKPIKPGGRKK